MENSTILWHMPEIEQIQVLKSLGTSDFCLNVTFHHIKKEAFPFPFPVTLYSRTLTYFSSSHMTYYVLFFTN